MDIFTQKQIIYESIYKLLEEFTEFNEGDNVSTRENGNGIINLSKHPYYSVRLSDTGVTKSFHYNQLKPKSEDLGKYDINESEGDEIIFLDGILISDTTIQTLGSLLSDIRSILGVTIVRSEDKFDNKEYLNTHYKSQIHIKIDPVQYVGKSKEEVMDYVGKQIRKLDGVRSFTKNSPQQIKPKTQPEPRNLIPQKSPNISEVKKALKEIKIHKPNNINTVDEYATALNDYFYSIWDDIKDVEETGLTDEMKKSIVTKMHDIYRRTKIYYHAEWMGEAISKYIGVPLNLKSSGGFWSFLTDIDGFINEYIAETFNVSEDEMYELFRNNFDADRLPFR